MYIYIQLRMGCTQPQKKPLKQKKSQHWDFIRTGTSPFRYVQKDNLRRFNQQFYLGCKGLKSTQSIMGENDFRQQVKDLSQYPLSAIGLVVNRVDRQNIFGTGFLISNCLVLTSADIFFHEESIQTPMFIPSFNGQFGQSSNVQQIKIPREYQQATSQKEKRKFNFALLSLCENFGQKYGTFGLDFNSKENEEEGYLYGYTEKIGKQYDGNKIMLGMKGPLTISENEIRYNSISTSPGQVGSPIFVLRDGKPYVIGIHTGGNSEFNFGVAINIVRNYLNQWIKSKNEESTYEEKLKSFEELSTIKQLQIQKSQRGGIKCRKIIHFSQKVSTNGFDKIYVDYIPDFFNLEVLKMSSLSLNGLFWGTEYLSNLRILDCSKNIIQQLPQKIDQLQNLQQLNASKNRLKSLPSSIGNLVNLQDLDVSNNQLLTLPSSITQLVSLKRLNISHNNILSIQLPDIIRTFVGKFK